ncbi:hypothetical protein [Peristeroidobacter soli]|nr:hypothetical protein [Peristeroidobacter soli]
MTELEEGMDIELLDLGDAMLETRESGMYPIVFDSYYLLGERVP